MLFKRKDAAQYLHVEPKTLDEWVRRAGMKYAPDGTGLDKRLRLLSKEQLDELAHIHATGPSKTMEERLAALESLITKLTAPMATTPPPLAAAAPLLLNSERVPYSPVTKALSVPRGTPVDSEQKLRVIAALPPGSAFLPDWCRRHNIKEKTGWQAIPKRLSPDRGECERVLVNGVPVWVLSRWGQARAYALWGGERYAKFTPCPECPHYMPPTLEAVPFGGRGGLDHAAVVVDADE